jgi:hypothetical protein
MHPDYEEACGEGVFACHRRVHRDIPCSARGENGENRVLTYMPYITGSVLLRSMDLAQLNPSAFSPGELVVRLFSNEKALSDDNGQVQAYFVTMGDELDQDVDVSALTDLALAPTLFRDYLLLHAWPIDVSR